LEGFDEICVCTAYRRGDETLHYLPADQQHALEPVYQTFAGWGKTEVTGSLPQALETYLAFLEQELQTPVRYVSLGPGREALRPRATVVG
jgi:adenylosuccinate synthase